MLYFFVDFDGVVHTHNGRRFSLVENLAKVVRKFPEMKIVFSTSWREHATLEFLKNFFPEDIQHQCVGMTPWIRENIHHVRYHEIQQYLKENNIKNPWLAIDDLAILFPQNCENLFLVNGREGVTKPTAKLLEKRIKEIIQQHKEGS